MKKKPKTRIPAARIKKIMQTDDDVGKIAMATPILISKALELFLQDLCDRMYEITLEKGAKTLNAHHLKQCVHTHALFDFLKETVASIPDLGVEVGGGSDKSRRRKSAEVDNGGGSVTKRSRSRSDPPSTRESGRGGDRGRKSKNVRARSGKAEDNEASSPSSSPHLSEVGSNSTNFCEGETRSADKSSEMHTQCPKDFDLNAEPNEYGEVTNTEKAVEQDLRTGPFLGHNQNIFQQEDDYDAEDDE